MKISKNRIYLGIAIIFVAVFFFIFSFSKKTEKVEVTPVDVTPITHSWDLPDNKPIYPCSPHDDCEKGA